MNRRSGRGLGVSSRWKYRCRGSGVWGANARNFQDGAIGASRIVAEGKCSKSRRLSTDGWQVDELLRRRKLFLKMSLLQMRSTESD